MTRPLYVASWIVWLVSVGSLVLLFVLGGCTPEAPPRPPVPPAPEDLSTWAVPELVQPPAPVTPIPMPVVDKPTSAEQVLDYAPSTTYTLPVAVDAPLDLVLQRGEQVRNALLGSREPVEPNQTTAWELKEGAHGTGDTLQHHLFLSAAKPGLTTGAVVTTTARTYYLSLRSVTKSPIRTVRWRYPADPIVAAKPTEPGLLPDPMQPKRWHVGYELRSTQKQPPDWLPRGAWDDGKKMYVVLPEITLFEVAPLVRMIGPNGPQLVNARTYLNVLIIDQLAPRLELRVGTGEHAEVVTIARSQLRTIECPGSPDCPAWPAAAQTLAQKGAQP